MRNSERIAQDAYDRLPARHKSLVMEWRNHGADWATALLSSGVLSAHGPYIHPDQAQRETEREHIEQILLDRQRLMAPVDETYRLREAAEHEASHAIVAQSFGLDVKLAYTLPGGTGSCLYQAGDPFQTAAVAMGPELWLGTFRALEYPRGPTGCEDDRRTAITAVAGDTEDLRRAHRYCYHIFTEHSATVLAVADHLTEHGTYFP